MVATQVASSFGCTVAFTNDIQTELAGMLDAHKDFTSLMWIETPSNPTLSLVDVQAVANTAPSGGALVVVDNTSLSPYIQNPLEHKTGILLHSVAKSSMDTA